MNMRVLLLGDNHFSGPIPDSVKSLYKLTHLSLHNNQLSGTATCTASCSSFIRWIPYLWFPNAVGPLPDWLEDMTHLHDLHLYGNKFEGDIPMSAEELFERKRERMLSKERQKLSLRSIDTNTSSYNNSNGFSNRRDDVSADVSVVSVEYL
jgi:hypothetical protein